MKQLARIVLMVVCFGAGTPALAAGGADMDREIVQLQHEWARIKYRLADEDRQLAAMNALAQRADGLVKQFPKRAEPLIWDAIITSTAAGFSGGFSALGKAKAARKLLLVAEKLDATALQGSVYTSLGSLYYQVPGWPLGFGSNKKARAYLGKALALNPDGIDPNYFYGDFLAGRHQYAKAAQVLAHALKAPARPARPLADQGRRTEINDLLARVRPHLKSAS